MSCGEKGLSNLIGKKILKIYMNENYLKFETDDGNIVFGVEGDCCSQSLFYDFYGVKKLFGKVVKSIKDVELTADDIKTIKGSYGEESSDKKGEHECISVYGYRITTEDNSLGDVSSVFSFRNYSNGYYGGNLTDEEDLKVSPEIFDDVVETEAVNPPLN